MNGISGLTFVGICEAPESQCPGSDECIYDVHFCDGYPDCSNGADEVDCGAFARTVIS